MPSQETHLRIVNGTRTDIRATIVTGIDPFDWEDQMGPEGNFQGVQILAGQAAEKREEVNRYASHCPFTMSLLFEDDTKDTFRINQKFAINEAPPDFSHSEGSRIIMYDQQSPYLIITVFDHA